MYQKLSKAAKLEKCGCYIVLNTQFSTCAINLSSVAAAHF